MQGAIVLIAAKRGPDQ